MSNVAIDIATVTGLVIGSGVATRQVIEFIKERWLWFRQNSLAILGGSILTNTGIALGWAYWQGLDVSVATMGAVLQVVVSVWFQEYKKEQKARIAGS